MKGNFLFLAFSLIPMSVYADWELVVDERSRFKCQIGLNTMT